jgi:Putative zinc-finger
MNHSEAIESMAAEGYLLGDLSGAERNAFEEHYIDCPICAQAVWYGTEMFAAGRELVRSVPAPQPSPIPPPLTFRQRFRQAMPFATAAALTVVVGYQGVVIPLVQRAAAVPVIAALFPTEPLIGVTRTSNQVIKVPRNTAFVLYPEVPSDAPIYPLYRFELRSARGKALGDTEVSEKQARSGEPNPLAVCPLPAGSYVLVILGVRKDGNRPEVTGEIYRAFVVVQ